MQTVVTPEECEGDTVDVLEQERGRLALAIEAAWQRYSDMGLNDAEMPSVRWVAERVRRNDFKDFLP